MPKLNYDYTAFSIKKLLNDVSQKAQVVINNISDCSILSSILAKNNFSISKDTLARLYKVIASKSAPSKYTLDILSSYLGYQHWDNFYQKFRKENNGNPILNGIKSDLISDNELMLINYCIEDNAFNPVINYLKTIIPNVSDPFGNDAKKIANLVGRTSRINSKVQKEILPIVTKNKELRDAVFTWWVDVDGLNTHYANIIETQYIKHLNKLDVDFLKNELWAYSMLMHNAFYNQNIKEFTKSAYYLFTKYKPEQISIKQGIAAFPFARYHSNHIIYRHLYNSKTSTFWYDEKIKFIKDEIATIPNHAKIIIIGFIVEALAIAKKYEVILYFSEEYKTLTTEFIQNNKITREEDSLIKMIYYYNLASSKLKLLNEDEKKQIIKLEGIEQYFTYQNHFSYFHNSAIQLFESEQKLKKQYLLQAKKHAQTINNKFFLSEICKTNKK